MRARQRHLNAGNAGAVLVLDSRFIRDLNDNDPVSTWIDRSGNGNNVTQTSTSRPTYKVAQQGGQPVIRFDGINDFMFNTSTNLVTAGSQWSLIASGKMDAALGDLRGSVLTVRTTVRYWSCMYLTFSSSLYINANGIDTHANSIISASDFPHLSPWVSSWVMNGNGNQPSHFTNGQSRVVISPGSIQVTETGVTGFLVCNNAVNQFNFGDVWSIVVVPGAISLSLRRRIEHNTAFSFKIACS